MRSLQFMLDNWEKEIIETAIYALKRGERFFRSGRRCKKLHPPVRYVSGGRCYCCAKEKSSGVPLSWEAA